MALPQHRTVLVRGQSLMLTLHQERVLYQEFTIDCAPLEHPVSATLEHTPKVHLSISWHFNQSRSQHRSPLLWEVACYAGTVAIHGH
jgi:hypothetical protein